MTVATSAMMTEVKTALLTPSLLNIFTHHCVENPFGGQLNELLELNELITTTNSGK
jgi:hypothetical protein